MATSVIKRSFDAYAFDRTPIRSYYCSIERVYSCCTVEGLTFLRHVEQMFGISDENRYSLLSTQELGHGRSSDGGNRHGRHHNRCFRHRPSGGTQTKGAAGRKPKGSVPVVIPDTPDKPDPDHVLTWRQRKVLQVIRESVQKRGYPPSMREIGEAVGLTSTSSVSYQLSTLQRKGYLHRDVGRPRTVEVRLPGHPAVRPERPDEPGGGRGRPTSRASTSRRRRPPTCRWSGGSPRAARSSPSRRSKTCSRCPGSWSARARCSCSRWPATR